MDDFKYQENFVKQDSRRMLWMQDRHPLSGSYGCFHYPYWRDKVCEFADIRFQEAGAALGLLTHPAFYDPELPPKEVLYDAFSAGAGFWAREQHRDGSFDEWYKNEHGFAATTFTLIAYGLAIHFLGERVEEADRKTLMSTAKKAADWLLYNDDLVKTNHQAAGAAALAIMYRISNEEKYRAGAAEKHKKVLTLQTDEGWFNEIAGMDLGYCGVLLDYMMLYRYMTKDSSGIDAMKRLYTFMYPFIQPDLTISPEAGICLNPYVSRLGTVLLSEHSPEAASVAAEFDKRDAGFPGVEPYLGDDLRLCRWSYLPLVTQLLKEEMKKESRFLKALKDTSAVKAISAFHKDAGIFSHKREGFHLLFLPAGGGVVRAFYSDNKGMMHTCEDLGYSYTDPELSPHSLFTGGYCKTRNTKTDNASVTAQIHFVPAKFFFPPFIARLALRIGCSVPYLSYWIRKLIDIYRKKKGTAINQSVAPLTGHKSGLTLNRRVVAEDGFFRIEDEIICTKGEGIDLSRLKMRMQNGAGRGIAAGLIYKSGREKVKSLRIVKDITTSGNGFSINLSLR